MSQTIFRVSSRHKPYSQLGNAMIRDGRLSWEARAALSYILSFPSDWQFSLTWFCKETKTGRDKARRMVKELVEAGYCARDRARNNDGTLGAYEYVFTDEPAHIEPAPENTTIGTPVTGQPALANPTVTKTKEDPKKITNDRSSEFSEDDFGPRRAAMPRFVSEAALDRVHSLAPGWDRQFLLRKFTDWEGSANAASLDAAFLGWVKRFTKGRDPFGNERASFERGGIAMVMARLGTPQHQRWVEHYRKTDLAAARFAETHDVQVPSEWPPAAAKSERGAA